MFSFALHRLSRAAPAALTPLAFGIAFALALDPGWPATLGRAAAGAALTLGLTLAALTAGTLTGALLGLAGAGFAAAGWPGRVLGMLGPAVPGFLLAGLAAAAGFATPAAAVAVLAVPAACQAARLTAGGLADALAGPAVRTMEGFGLGHGALLWRHAVPLALAPMAAGLGTAVLAALTAGAAVETLCGLPGAGALLVEAARQGEAGPALLALGVLCALAVLLRALAGVVHGWLDPRTRMA